MTQRSRESLNFSELMLSLYQAHSAVDLKKVVDDISFSIKKFGSTILISHWDARKNKILNFFQESDINITDTKESINTLLHELKKIQENLPVATINLPASNRSASSLYERISHFVQARKERLAKMRQEKNETLKNIDVIIKDLHLIKKSLIVLKDKNELAYAKKHTEMIKEKLYEVLKSRAYSKSTAVMMNAESAISRFQSVTNLLDKKLLAHKAKSSTPTQNEKIKAFLNHAVKSKNKSKSGKKNKDPSPPRL